MAVSMRNMLRNLGAKGAGAPTSAFGGPMVDAAQRLEMLDAFEEEDICWFWITDPESRLVYLSPSALRKFDPQRKVIGEALGSIVETAAVEEGQRSERPLSYLLTAHHRFSATTVRVDLGERGVYWSLTGKPQFDAAGKFMGYRGSARDITDAYEQQLDALRLAQYDSLTGLANRHHMARRLGSMLTTLRAAKRSCALLMLDLDRFKQVNDTLGHPAGDDLLKQVGQRLERIVPSPAEIGRLGGDEFQIIIPDVDDRGRLGEIAQRIIQMLSQPYSVDGRRAIIGTSVGIAVAPYDGIEPEELVKSADLALYAAKGGSRGQYRFYSNDLKDSAHDRHQIEEELRDALARGELTLQYQPVVRAADEIVAGFEALMRWEHPERGSISPNVFIPIAEDCNLIAPLGDWALRQACMDAAQWPGTITVAVNVSVAQFSSGNLPTLVAAALAASGLDPARLELEITESVFMGDADAIDRTFRQLKRIGVKLSLDDFGTGYSSLGYLRKAPFDKIKIDQSFVRGCTEADNSNSAIITAIVSLANALNMETIAEGVEAMDELAMVRQRGATNIQGFIYSGAVSQENLLAKLSTGDFSYKPSGPDKYRAERKTLLRTVGIIHEDYRYDAVLRNLSRTGAMIEGLLEVPKGTDLVLDLGEGQLVVATVRRSRDSTQGIEFETPLISDGADSLCTRHRISPYALAAAGMPLQALPPGNYTHFKDLLDGQGQARFIQVEMTAAGRRAAAA
jgi:diguanylate cyclase (GGDEF)-like protein